MPPCSRLPARTLSARRSGCPRPVSSRCSFASRRVVSATVTGTRPPAPRRRLPRPCSATKARAWSRWSGPQSRGSLSATRSCSPGCPAAALQAMLRGELSLCANSTSQMGRGCLPSGEIHLSGPRSSPHVSLLVPVHLCPSCGRRRAFLCPAAGRCRPRGRLPRRVCRDDWGGRRLQQGEGGAGVLRVIFGGGGVGLSALIAARLAGAGTVVVVDPVASKRGSPKSSARPPPWTARTPTSSRAPREVPRRRRLRLRGGRPAVIGRDRLRRVRPGGMVVLVGVPADGSWCPSRERVVRSEKIVTGTFYGPHAPVDMAADHAPVRRGQVSARPIRQRGVPARPGQRGLAAMVEGRVVRGC